MEGSVQSENNKPGTGKSGGAYMFIRMSDVYGKVVEATVLGEATSAIEWEAEQFITVSNATVDYDKKKLTIGSDAVVHDRSQGNRIPFPDSFEDVQW